ncbi:MAG: DUF1659 domain-containing protein [Synergistaceae bacterium]|jgi:hypothetical protein|nr:DUF1659 domain-containing protein [Synergistaceae bacterium]
MANFSEISARVAFKVDTGEIKNDKPVYRSISIGNIKGSVSADDLGDVAGRLENLLEFQTETITLTRKDQLEL